MTDLAELRWHDPAATQHQGSALIT
jgi:hypothetical protein